MSDAVERWVASIESLSSDLIGWLEKAYPEEGCGLVVSRDGDIEFWRCDNVINRYHEADPETYPRDASDFYMIDPRRFMEAEAGDNQLAVIVHSHPDAGDYFSEADVESALMPSEEGEPREAIYPDVCYLVVSVVEGRAQRASLFKFEAGGEEASFPRVARWEVTEEQRLRAVDI